ncbi:MAG TPA: PAS domain-containing sensor histidine kinase [Gemmatimonadaceae bacterium]
MLPLSDSLVAAILSVSADAIICVDRDQRITFFNEGAENIFGYASKEILGQPVALLLPERFRSSHGALMESFGSAQLSSRRMGERSLISGVRKNGEEFIAEAAIAHMPSEIGSVFSVVLRDVTEQRRAQEMNERLLVEMERAVKQRDEMLALVSHDLRNPANAVKMLAGAILRSADASGPGLSPDVADHAAVMLQAASQMDALIQDLLDSTRLEAGRLRVSPQWSRPEDLVLAAMETLSPLALAKSITLSMNVPPELPEVYADPGRTNQVLSNLIGNSLKFTAEGGKVTIEGTVEGKFVLFAVRDTGVGIPPADLPFVFNRFWQAKRMNRSGAGLGLAIARGIVLGHGGRIWIESAPGVETAVRFTLPTKESAGVRP